MMPKITICGSMSFYEQMNLLADQLREMGFDVYSPQLGEGADYSKMSDVEINRVKGRYVSLHRENIETSDAILVANYPKGGVKDYLGASTLIEMGFAYAYGKKIFLLFNIPSDGKKVEAFGLGVIPLNEKIENINSLL